MRKLILVILLALTISACNANIQYDSNKVASSFNSDISSNLDVKEANINQAITEFMWLDTGNKPFFEAFGISGGDASVSIIDIDCDGENEILISEFGQYRSVKINEMFKIVDGKLTSIGGFVGSLNDNSQETSKVSLYKNEQEQLFFITYAISNYSTSSCIISSVNIDNFENRALFGYEKAYDNQDIENYYLFNELKGKSRSFYESDFRTEEKSSVNFDLYSQEYNKFFDGLNEIRSINIKEIFKYNLNNVPDITLMDTEPELYNELISIYNTDEGKERSQNLIANNILEFYSKMDQLDNNQQGFKH